MRCRSCGTSNRDDPDLRFCEQCGVPLVPPALPVAPTIVCGSCTHPNPADHSFCELCGATLRSVPATASRRPAAGGPGGGGARSRPPERRRAGRWIGFTLALALVGGAATTAYLSGAFDRGSDGGTSTTGQGTSPASGSESASATTAPSSAAGAPVREPDQLGSLLRSTGVGSDPLLDPSAGITITDSDGTGYLYDGSTWSAIDMAGDVWIQPRASATIAEVGGSLAVTSDGDPSWVNDILASVPGVTRSGDEFVVDDPAAYEGAIAATAADNGAVVDDAEASIRVFEPERSGVVFIDADSTRAWVIDDTAAVLLIPHGDGVVVAGVLVPDSGGEASFQPADTTPEVSAAADTVLSNIDGAIRKGTSWSVVLGKPEASGAADEAVTTTGGGVASTHKKKKTCSWSNPFSCARDTIRSGATALASGAADATGDVLSAGGTVLETGWHEAKGLGEAGLHYSWEGLKCTVECTLDGLAWSWAKLSSLWAERDCGSPGPGPGPDGTGAPEYPKAGYSVEAAASNARTDPVDELALARLWMPRIELSKDEQCGEMLRILAAVYPYAPGGGRANSLAVADRVEITYTLFYREDGGRFRIEHHLGDNEGFVISLTRTDRSDGLCSSGFELFGGRTVGHKDAKGSFQSLLRVTEREINDFGPAEVGTPCPQPDDPAYRLLVSESKHAAYYDRGVCERALIPDLPLLLPVLIAAAVGSEGVDLYMYGTSTAVSAWVIQMGIDAILDRAPASVRNNLRNGLEECESGRSLLDLSERVELYTDDYVDAQAQVLGFPGVYLSADGKVTYAAEQRGAWCDAFQRPSCLDYDYHVPGFFEAEATPPIVQQVGVPDVRGATEADARAALEALGLVMVVAGSRETSADLVGRVVEQSPLSVGVDAGSTVQVWIGVEGGVETVTIPTQVLDPDAAAHDEITLSRNFPTDPYQSSGVSGGPVDVSYISGSAPGLECAGFAAKAPDFRLHWSMGGLLPHRLRFYFAADSGDTTLIIRDPNGDWHCSDDTYNTFDPTIDIENAPAGNYEIWVGSIASASTFLPGFLNITELDSHP